MECKNKSRLAIHNEILKYILHLVFFIVSGRFRNTITSHDIVLFEPLIDARHGDFACFKNQFSALANFKVLVKALRSGSMHAYQSLFVWIVETRQLKFIHSFLKKKLARAQV